MPGRLSLFVLVFGLLYSSSGHCAEVEELSTLNGPTVIRFDRPLEELTIPSGRQFGVFRALEPKSKQNITEQWRVERLPGLGGTVGALVLKYTVNDGYNGFWLKLAPDGKTADWSEFEKGYLVLRVLHAPPVWKLELKDRSSTSSVVVRMRREHHAEVASRGYADIVIPLRSFYTPWMSELRELVLVYESSRLAPAFRSGEMQVAEIGLSKTQRLAPSADEILDDLGNRAFAWFQKHRHPVTGLVLDRAPNREDFKPDPVKPAMSSVASVGYFLSLLPEWTRLGYLSRSRAEQQATQTLTTVVERVEHYEGALYHFVDWSTERRWRTSEVGLLDHAICANGAATVAVAFGGEVEVLANRLLDRVDWTKFVTVDRRTGKNLLALGWSPEEGLLGPADVRSSEMAMPYLLAVGSKNPIDPECWYNTTVNYGTRFSQKVLNAEHPLFTSVYGLNWHDLEGRLDRDGVDLYGNARSAALVNRAFCREAGQRESTYSLSEGGWYGISAGDSPTGYVAAGPVPGDADSVVWPEVALASLPWIAEELLQDLPVWRASQAWYLACGPYGISPFRLGDRPWVGSDLIGIDIGSFAASLANYRNRTIWDLWRRHPVAHSALEKLGYTPKPTTGP